MVPLRAVYEVFIAFAATDKAEKASRILTGGGPPMPVQVDVDYYRQFEPDHAMPFQGPGAPGFSKLRIFLIGVSCL